MLPYNITTLMGLENVHCWYFDDKADWKRRTLRYLLGKLPAGRAEPCMDEHISADEHLYRGLVIGCASRGCNGVRVGSRAIYS